MLSSRGLSATLDLGIKCRSALEIKVKTFTSANTANQLLNLQPQKKQLPFLGLFLLCGIDPAPQSKYVLAEQRNAQRKPVFSEKGGIIKDIAKMSGQQARLWG